MLTDDLPGDGAPDDLVALVRELESHAAGAGWDQPPRLFALVDTAHLLAANPALADQLDRHDGLTSVEQEDVPAEDFESFLATLSWPAAVAGCAAVMERLVLPPSVEEELPDDPFEAAEYAAGHPDRQEVRMVAAVTRAGSTACALRLREHDEDAAVLTGPDLVPRLLQALGGTLQGEED